MASNLLYIGIHGLAGSGKDTLAKILHILFNNKFASFEEFSNYWHELLGHSPKKLATYNSTLPTKDCNSMCIAFADQLKHLCAVMFGIPVDRFYYNKANSWICINKDFKYTEVEPDVSHIVDADKYFYGLTEYESTQERYYMSLRDVLVYVGTYVCQRFVNQITFVNVVQNEISRNAQHNKNLKYVIVTDVRFDHEMDFIKKHNGIMIDVVRDDVKQLDNIAEHEMDDVESYDITVDNSGTYEDLLKVVWDMVHDNIVFKNNTIDLLTRDETHNFLRQIEDNKWQFCSEHNHNTLFRMSYSDKSISMIDASGGPTIYKNSVIEGTDLLVKSIDICPLTNKITISI